MEGEGSAWAIKPGTAWAEEVEAEEAKHGPLVSEEAFPSLGESAKQPSKTTKKQKGQKLSLSDFNAFPVRRGQTSDKELLMQLPKSSSGLPKEERGASGLGGGFKDYGGNRQGGFGGRREERDEREPSRADSSGDWGSERKFVPSDRPGGSSGYGRDREGGFGERRGGGGGFGDRPPREDRPTSEADTVDNWGANRKFQPASDSSDRRGPGGGFGGGGFRDRERPSGPPRFNDDASRADAGDWGARRSTPDGDRPAPGGRRGYGFSDQPTSQADVEDKWSHRGPPAEPSSSSDRAPAERPKLKLAPRTLPLPEQQQQTNGVASPRGSEAGSSSSGHQPEQKARKSNPFGEARPREEVLKEKGIDYQKEELKLEHGEVLRDPTPEEDGMEAEVEGLRKQLEELQAATPDETDTISDVKKELDEKERALYTLQAKLDDELRYSKHKPERERDGPARGSSGSAADDLSGFEQVRNARRERPAAPADGEAAAAGSREQEREGGAPAAAGGGGGAWGRGGSSFSRDHDRDGGRDGGRGGGFGGGGFRDRDGGRGPPPPRERRPNESMARSGGGW